MRVPRAGHAWAIAVTELRVAWRGFWKKGRVQQAIIGIAAAMGVVVTLVGAVAAFRLGGAVQAGEIEQPVEQGALLAAALFVGSFGFSAYLTAIQYGDTDVRDGLLTTVRHADLAGGLLVATFLRIWSVFVAPILLAALAFGAGAGDPVAVALAIVAVILVVGPGYALGFALGLALKHLFAQSETVVRYRAVLGIAAFGAYLTLLVTDRFDTVFEPILDAARASPIAWVADLALLSLAAGSEPLQAGLAVVGGTVTLGLGVLATVRASEALWYADPVTATPGTESSMGVGPLGQLLGRRAAWITVKSWTRARRAPLKLIYVVYPLFVLIEPVQASLQRGAIAVTLPAYIAVYGAWSTGAAFGLNPFGDEGAVLPITATTGVDGRTFVRGLLAAGLVPGLPATVLLTGVLAAFSPVALPTAAGLAVGAAALCVGAAGVAVGVGVVFPRYEAANISRSRAVVVPSTWAFITYTLIVTLLATPATALQVPGITRVVAERVGIGPGLVRVGGLVLAAVLVGAAGTVATRYAARAFDAYTAT
ncbi:MAG: hypothetical protein ABEJ35_06570 [Halobacteriaceae archaeon]